MMTDSPGEPVLENGGEPVFAELAVLRLLQDDGWDGVWVDTYLPEPLGFVGAGAEEATVTAARRGWRRPGAARRYSNSSSLSR